MSQNPPPGPPYPQPPIPPGYDPNYLPYAMPAIPLNRRPTSVSVLAIIGIVLAALALIGSLCGALQAAIKTGPNPVADAIHADPFLAKWQVGGTILTLILAALELACCIACLNLKSWGRVGLIAYSWIAIVIGLISAWINYRYLMPVVTKAMIQQGAAGPNPLPPAFGSMVGGMTVGCGLLGLLYPIFVLLFFSRPNVKLAFAPDRAGNP